MAAVMTMTMTMMVLIRTYTHGGMHHAALTTTIDTLTHTLYDSVDDDY